MRNQECGDPLSDQVRARAALIRGGHWDMVATAELLDRTARQIEIDRDRLAVLRFSRLMGGKMIRNSLEGAAGWPNVPVAHLWAMLREHVEKGDPIDIANFAMMIHHNTEAQADERKTP